MFEIHTEPVKNGVPAIFDWYEKGKLVEVSVWVVTDIA